MDITPELRQQLIKAGWSPPAETEDMLAGERDHISRGYRALGHGEGDTTPVYLLVENHGATVIPIQRTTYEQAVTSYGLAELIDDRADDSITATYRVLAVGDAPPPIDLPNPV